MLNLTSNLVYKKTHIHISLAGEEALPGWELSTGWTGG